MNKYNRVKQIGEGAFGKAVLVKRKDTSKQCVIKEINIIKMTQKEREEARKETAVLAQLKHPNIVSYIESFEERGSLYIVMNFCSGGDMLAKITERRGRLFSEDQILDWFVQLCLAVKHIHDRKILHRDIKSQNIFLTHTGTVQLGDFGIAKVLSNTMQLAHTCIGTPFYLSPEIVENMPYNNKSDIWSMGCVLYELATLKHAFEAGNMKNLVLKIIRGSYPPISPQYSYDLRGLIAQLFKRHPRDRPTVNAILRKNFVMQRVRRLLSEEDLADEFSHTVMHGHKLAKAFPPAPKPSADPAKKARPGSANRRYDPANVYGVSNSRNRLSGDQKKRPTTPGARPVPVPGQADWDKKQRDRKEVEQRRRIEMRKREQEMYERRHRELIDKQKVARINKAREEGWNNFVLDPVGVDANRAMAAREARPKSPRPLPIPKSNDDQDRGNYEAYNAYLAHLWKDRETPPPDPKSLNPNHIEVLNIAVPRPVPQPHHPFPAPRHMGPLGVALPAAIDQAGRDRQQGAQAAHRARVVEDYLQRQREAQVNKQRAQRDIYGSRPNSAARRTPVPAPRGGGGRRGGGGGGGMVARNNEEQEYLEKLRQIRNQNMRDRRAGGGVNVGENADIEARHVEEAEERKKKVEALRAQAEQWAEAKREELEKQRKEILPQGKVPSPMPAMPMTDVLNAIGGEQQPEAQPGPQLTKAMEAVKGVERAQQERPKTAEQKKKDDILKKLNKNAAARSKWGQPASPVPPAKDRGKWGPAAGATGALAVQEDPEEAPESSRSQWGDGGRQLRLSNVPLELTASQMEATSSQDKVIKMAVDSTTATTARIHQEESENTSRRHWGHGSKVINALEKLPICPDSITRSDSSSESTPTPPVGVGSTITVSSKPFVASSTITVGQASKPDQAPPPLLPERSGTIVLSKDRPENLPYTVPNIRSPSHSGEQELSSSLHFQTVQSPSDISDNSQQAVGEGELPSSIRFFGSEQDAAKMPANERLFNRVAANPSSLDILMEVSESQSLSKTQQDDLSDQFKAYLVQREYEQDSAEDGNQEKKTLQKATTEKSKSKFEQQRDGAKSVQMNLTTGHFDMENVKLLRTCSEPDLASMSRTLGGEGSVTPHKGQGTQESVTPSTIRRHKSLDFSTVEEDGDDDTVKNMTAATGDGDHGDLSEEDIEIYEDDEEEEEDNDENNDDDDIRSMMESMQSLLDEEDEQEENIDKKAGVKFKTSPDIMKTAPENKVKSKPSRKALTSGGGDNSTENSGIVTSLPGSRGGKEVSGDDGDNEDDDDQYDEEDEENAKQEKLELAAALELENGTDSDDETIFGDEGEDYDQFGRLEQCRMELQTELGVKKLVQVYQTIQKFMENENSTMESGAKVAVELLGPEKEHLFPKLLQLVMSDTAFTDDND